MLIYVRFGFKQSPNPKDLCFRFYTHWFCSVLYFFSAATYFFIREEWTEQSSNFLVIGSEQMSWNRRLLFHLEVNTGK